MDTTAYFLWRMIFVSDIFSTRYFLSFFKTLIPKPIPPAATAMPVAVIAVGIPKKLAATPRVNPAVGPATGAAVPAVLIITAAAATVMEMDTIHAAQTAAFVAIILITLSANSPSIIIVSWLFFNASASSFSVVILVTSDIWIYKYFYLIKCT